MWKALVCTSLTSVSAAAAVHFDPPDLRYELELHRKYVASQGSASALAVDGGPLLTPATGSYGIQSKETLRQLSEMLYGDASYWPRVWAQSNSVAKPHLIRPGHTIEFRMGTEDEMPAFRISEQDEEPGIELVASNSYNPLIEIPPPEVSPKPVLPVPPSFPEWQQIYKRTEMPGLDASGLRQKRPQPPDKIYLTAYVQEEKLDPAGFFLENDKHSALPVTNQYVYIKMKKGLGQVGQKLLIVRDQGKLSIHNPQLLDDEIEAHLIQVVGELEVTEAVPSEFRRSRDREGFDAFRALITKATGLAIAGSELILGDMAIVDLKPTGQTGSAVAQIIGAEKHKASALYGPGEIVFLDKGSSSGVEPGQMLDLFTNRISRNGDTPVEYSPVPSGKVKVVKVSGKLATAVVLESREGVMQGDRVQQVSSRRDGEKLDFEFEESFEDGADSFGGEEEFKIDFGGESGIEDELEALDEF